MENLSKEEQMLIKYLDGQLSGEERQQVEKIISESENLKSRLHDLQVADSLLSNYKNAEIPSKNFTTKVLQNLYSYNPGKLPVSKNGIFLLAGIVVAVGLASYLLSFGSYDMLNGTVELQSFTIRKNLVTLPTINFPGKLIVNIILIATTAISFIVLDRIVLRPLFEKRASLGK